MLLFCRVTINLKESRMNIKRSLIGFFMLTVIAFFSGCIGKSTDCTLDCQTLNETVKGIEILYIYEEDKEREVL